MKNLTKNLDEDQWDKKKMLILGFFLVVGILIVLELKGMFIDKNKSVLGEINISKTKEIEKPNIKPPSVNFQSEVGGRLEEIKRNINSIDAEDVASSSPQIQKVLQDIQGIKNLPASQAKDACLKICSGI